MSATRRGARVFQRRPAKTCMPSRSHGQVGEVSHCLAAARQGQPKDDP
jgi:hypothetical protein